MAAADARGGGSVLQHQEAERREAAAAGQRGGEDSNTHTHDDDDEDDNDDDIQCGALGREDQEEEELSVWNVSCSSQLLAGRRRPQDSLRQVSHL